MILRGEDGTYADTVPLGAIAVDGSRLDRSGWGCRYGSAWLQPEGCCVLGRFDSLVPIELRTCHRHPRPLGDRWLIRSRLMWRFNPDELRAHEEARWARIRAQYAIPPLFHGVSLDGSEQTDLVKRGQKFLAECGIDEIDAAVGHVRALTIAGGTGVGKTHTGVAMFREVAAGQLVDSFGWYDVRRLQARLLGEGDDDEDDLESFIEHLHGAEFLVVDDVGSGYQKKDGLIAAQFEALVVAREANPNVATVYTTNLVPATFREFVGDRAYDRIASGAWFNVPGPSLRGRRRLAVVGGTR